MKIILLDRVENLGTSGNLVNVKAGYARNYLFPKGKAIPATKKNIEYFEELRSELRKRLAKVLEDAKVRAEKISSLGSVIIIAKAGNEGKLFGSVGARDIADALVKVGINVTKSEVRLPHGVLRYIGEYEVKLQIHSEVLAKVIVKVVPE